MRRVVRAASPELLWTSGGADSPCSPELSYREIEDVFLQTQTRIWLGEILNIRFDEEIAIADLLADGELLFQVSKVVWKMLLKKHLDLKHSKLHIYERTSSGKSDGRYMAYPKVDSFLKICQILGLTGIDLFSPSDVVEKRDVRRVCMCIRSLSKRSRLKNLDVPDFDIVTYSIAMPTDLVGGIRRNLEQSQCSTSSSNGCSPMSVDSREIYRQRSIVGDHTRYYDSCSESDEAESTYMEHDFQSPLSNVSLDAAQLSHVVTQRSSDGNSIFEECLSELPNESQMDNRDLYEDGCKSPDLLAVSNGSSHSGTIKNGNEVFREVPNKSSCTESHSNQAVNNNFADTGLIVLPISNPETGCRSNNIDIGCLQTCALSSDDSPFKLDEQLSASAEEALKGCVGTMLRSECLGNPLSNCTSFGDHAKEEFVKAIKDPSDSSQEVKRATGVGECVVSECPILLEEVSHKTCANTTEASNSTCMKIGLKIKSFDEVVDAEVTSPSSLNVILDDEYANKFETNGCTSDGFLFSDDGHLKEVEQCDIEFENSSSELVVIVAEEDINTDLHDIKTNKDIALPQSGKISSSVRTDVTDRISASETESYVICGSCLLYHSVCDTREIHSCPETENSESIGSFSSTASRKQTNLGVLDDLQIDRELATESKASTRFYQLDETHLLETGDMNIVSGLNEICTQASCSGPTDMVGRVTCADESIGVKNLVLPHVDDIPTSMNHTEADDAGKWEKVIDVEEFDLQPPVLCSSGKGKEGETGELHRPGKKKLLRSIAGGISLAVAMFFVLHLKGRRGKEKNNRTGVSLQTPNSNQEQVVIGSTRGIYPTDRLKF